MENIYYVASLKLSGWLSKTSQYVTDISQAQEFTHAEAIQMCRRQAAGGNPVVPVRKRDMDMIV